MPDLSGIVWWMLTAVFALGFAATGFLLSHWFRRIEKTLERIWLEIKESRTTETNLLNQITEIRATCNERHGVHR